MSNLYGVIEINSTTMELPTLYDCGTYADVKAFTINCEACVVKSPTPP